MTKIHSLLILAFFALNAYSQTNQVTIQLPTNQRGIVHVKYHLGAKSERDELFVFPKVVPGMYEQDDFGQLVINMVVHYKDGTVKKIERKDKNAFEIPSHEKVRYLTYDVRHTLIDGKQKGMKYIFDPGGTFFDPEAYFLLNFHAIVGHFQSGKDEGFSVIIEKPEKMDGVGSLEKHSLTSKVDSVFAKSYYQLADCPMLYADYGEQDTLSFQLDNMKIDIAVYSETELLNAHSTEEVIKKSVLNAAQTPLLKNHLPNHYSFLFCFTKRNAFMQGALEHNTSSVYSMGIDTSFFEENLKDFISHEFLHILTPLNLHSELIDNFEFYNPEEFSKHLWLYEGITEYLAVKNNLNAGLIDTLGFFNQLNWKKRAATKYYKKLSMTDVSSNILSRKSQKYYSNFYDKGALTAFQLDYLISRESQGKKGLNDLLADLIEKYGQERPFEDESIIEEITGLYPETESCFQNQINGKEEVPLDTILNDLGVEFTKSKDSLFYERWNYGFRKVRYYTKEKVFEVENSIAKEKYGYKKLKILSVDGKKSEDLSVMVFFSERDGEAMLVEIQDGNDTKEITIIPEKRSGYYHPRMLKTPQNDTTKTKILNKVLEF